MTSASVESGPAEIDEILDGLRSFVRAEVRPRQTALAKGNDKVRLYAPDGRLLPEILRATAEVRAASARAGYYTMFVPESLGGAGLGYEALFRVWELIARECGSLQWLGFSAVAHWSRGPSHLLALADPGVRDELLPGLLDGTTTMCFGMSEPDAGSDPWMMGTRAVEVEGGWQLSGTKQWVTNAPYAELAVIFAVTDPAAAGARSGGISAFVVPTDSPGFSVDSVIEMFGHPGGDEGIIGLHEVFVPRRHLIGEPGEGLRLALSGVSFGRLYNAARSVGLAAWALRLATDYAEERISFGRPIIEHQGVAFPLAESAMEIHAARLMGIDCARALDAGRPARHELAMSKAYATETATRVIDRCMQVHGAMGFTNELGLSEAWQQVRRLCVADGTAEIMRTQIVKHLRRSARPS